MGLANIIRRRDQNANTITKIEKVYHIKNMGELKEKIVVPNLASDHKIFIFSKEIPIQLNKEYKEILIQYRNIINTKTNN